MRTRSFADPLRGAVVLLGVLAACSTEPSAPRETLASSATTDRSPGKIQCDADNAGITLPAGFCALVVADLTQNGAAAPARHMAITPNGDIFVAINSPG